MYMFILFLMVIILNIQNVYADAIYTANVQNGCVYSNNINAMFEPNVHVCSNGYYMPANYDGCVICPSVGTCNGGTFAFNENISQGISYATQINTDITHGCDVTLSGAWAAVFEPNSYTCQNGYYVPANTDGCVICPANSYCVGGTYTFNATTDQGIAECPIGYSSSAGASQCDANTITVNWGGYGTNNEQSQQTTCTYGGTITTPTTAPTKRGHTFMGWRFVAPSGN